MKIGAYQFAVTGSIAKNMETISKAVRLAAEGSARLLVFPECALIGYPTQDEQASNVDLQALETAFAQIQQLSTENSMYLLVGSVTKDGDAHYNSAVLFTPGGGEPTRYHKRALWGWDIENFVEGTPGGIWAIDELTIGVRICFEVRFPEYFRELYREKADLAIVLFNDISDIDDIERYQLITAHLRTRAVENVCTVLSVNDASLYQTAPTAVIDPDGRVVAELPRNAEGLLLYDFQATAPSFGAQGRRMISDRLTK